MPDTTITAAQLASLLQPPQIHHFEGVPHILTPAGYTVHSLEALLPAPRRISRNVDAHDVRGFVDYVNRYKTAATQLFAHPRNAPGIVARLDDHEPGAPSRTTHGCKFGCPHTEEWKRWTRSDNQDMTQVEFAQFIEDNQRDIVEPNGSELLTATLNFVDKGDAEFRSATRLSDGRVQFHFVEKDNNTEVRFPERLKLGLPVFEGQDFRVGVFAKLRYRVSRSGDNPGLTLKYVLDRPDLALSEAYERLLAHVASQCAVQLFRAI